MNYEIRFRPEAENDIEDAATWYENQRKELGQLFLDELQRSLNIIAENPALYSVVYRDIRRALLQKFPCAVFYRVKDKHVIVFGVMHCSRNPKRWRMRT